MGNTLGRKKTAKVMKMDGETIKFKTPIEAGQIVKDYPRHVLLESESVKHFGIRAKPLELHQQLSPKRLYLIVELPKDKGQQQPRRVRSVINMSAKDRLESLMLAKRSASDLSVMKPRSSSIMGVGSSGETRVKMRLPKAEVEKVMMESRNEEEAAEKIVELWRLMAMANNGGGGGGGPNVHEKHVGFLPLNQGEIHLAALSN